MKLAANLEQLLDRIASALERAYPEPESGSGLEGAAGFVWNAERGGLAPVEHISAVPLELLRGVDAQKQTLLDNTLQFALGWSANNALLWGARGMGKSSLIKAVHAEVVRQGHALRLIEIHREDIGSLPDCLALVRRSRHRVILYCDDLSFDSGDSSYKSLKAVLEGGLEGRPDNALFYATSNRRHLMPREMIENERSTAINPAETVEEKISLSDRFGLWIGFHNCSQDDYLAMIAGYVAHFGLDGDRAAIAAEALTWSAIRGARSGRVAWQFIQSLAGRQQKRLEIR
jgi:predicted AAA+ superfamily ATPase